MVTRTMVFQATEGLEKTIKYKKRERLEIRIVLSSSQVFLFDKETNEVHFIGVLKMELPFFELETFFINHKNNNEYELNIQFKKSLIGKAVERLS